MFKVLIQYIAFFLLLIFSLHLNADALLVIVAKDSSITSMNRRQLDRIYRRKTRINEQGERIMPINLNIDNPLRQAFSQKLFKQHPVEMEVFWNVQYFKGISPPYVVSSEEAMLRFVASTPTAIGYINACHLDSRVQVLMTLKIQENIHQLCENSSKRSTP